MSTPPSYLKKEHHISSVHSFIRSNISDVFPRCLLESIRPIVKRFGKIEMAWWIAPLLTASAQLKIRETESLVKLKKVSEV